MRSHWSIWSAALLLVAFTIGCSSGSNSSNSGSGSSDNSGSNAAATSNAGQRSGSSRSVIDITWGGNDQGYSGRYGGSRGRERSGSTRITNFRYDRGYYEKYVRTVDESGNPVAPIDQVKFVDVSANVASGSFTLDGATNPSTGAAVEPESETASSSVPFIKPDGSSATLDDFRGKPLVVVFTRGFPGYICPMCTTYTAQFTVAYPKIKELGAELLLVFPGPASEAEEFVSACNEICAQSQAEKLPFPVCLDADLKLVNKFNLKEDKSRPATMIFDASGKMRFGFIGQNPHERPNVDRVLRELKNLSDVSMPR